MNLHLIQTGQTGTYPAMGPLLLPQESTQTAIETRPAKAYARPIKSVPILPTVRAGASIQVGVGAVDSTVDAAGLSATGAFQRRISFNSSLSPSAAPRRSSIALSLSPMASLTLRPPLPPRLALLGVVTDNDAHTRDPISVPASAASSLATIVPGRHRPVPLAAVPIPPAGGAGAGEGGHDSQMDRMERVHLSIDGQGSVEFPFLLRRRSSAMLSSAASLATAAPHTTTAPAARASAKDDDALGTGRAWEEDGDRTLTLPRPSFIVPSPQTQPQPQLRTHQTVESGGQRIQDVELEVRMVDEVDVELCVLCQREKSRDEVVMREFELFWSLDDASGARDLSESEVIGDGEGGENTGQAMAGTSGGDDAKELAPVSSRQGGEGENRGPRGHTGLWLVCRDEAGCRLRATRQGGD